MNQIAVTAINCPKWCKW